ncbi:MAG: DUF4333 domain-containing protein [Cyanobacteria bacterium]|nr:DUF4333 domain-containing protein [Cyanobacteriota bacterium]
MRVELWKPTSTMGYGRWIAISIGLLGLTACGGGLDTAAIEADIQGDIERQGHRLQLKAVQCPRNISRQAGGYFRCVGELKPEGQFTINVTQTDEQGGVTWDVPNSAILLNLAKVEADIADTLSQTLGKRALVDCGDLYRINQPGDLFECRVVGGVELGAERVETVLVKITPEGDLTWHEVREAIAPLPEGASTPGTTPSSASNAGNVSNAGNSSAASTDPVEAAPRGSAGSRKDEFKPPPGGED